MKTLRKLATCCMIVAVPIAAQGCGSDDARESATPTKPSVCSSNSYFCTMTNPTDDKIKRAHDVMGCLSIRVTVLAWSAQRKATKIIISCGS